MTSPDEYDFLEDLLERIVSYASIPKLQVERVVGPILTIFIEDLLGKLQGLGGAKEEKMHLISPEWPLKKDGSNQSTNVDWLMLWPARQELFLVELKTDAGSGNDDQLKTYQEVAERVSKESAGFLLEDAKTIRDASTADWKYDFILSSANKYENDFRNCRKASVIYIVPAGLKPWLSEINGLDCHAFEDLPDCLGTSKDAAWMRIRQMLIKLDQTESKPRRGPLNSNDLAAIIAARLEQQFPGKQPQKIWFGKTGEGRFPNYQVEFEDGSIQPFWYSGSLYTLKPRFNDKRLDGPYVMPTLLAEKQAQS